MEITMPDNGKADIRKITGAVQDAVTYPILTRDITTSPPSDGAGIPGSRNGASLDNLAQDNIRRILGWRYRTDDIKGFLAALTNTVSLKQVKGHIEWDVKPQNYMVQADLGEITGAQASIYTRAKVALDQSTPLLNGLTLLGAPTCDIEDMEAMRALIRTELTGLVGELGVVGGPRVQRVDSLFSLLLGPTPDPKDPANVGGQLKQLATRFGLKSDNVNTIDDEQDYTNYLILVDYINSLYQTWSNQRDFFTGSAAPFLGTQLVLLSQTLDALVESVHEAYDAMDSVFFGPSDRQATMLRFFNESPISIADLFGWVEDFATNEGLQLVQEAGKDGIVAFRPTISRLEYLVFLTMTESRAHSSVPVHGFHTARVQRAVENVGDYLEQTEEKVEDIQRKPSAPLPTVQTVSPTSSGAGSSPTLTVLGANIQPGASISLISAEKPELGFAGKITAQPPAGTIGTTIAAKFILTFTLSATALGKYIVVVQNPDGQYAWLSDAFTITAPPPIIGKIDPSSGTGTLTVTIDGKNFLPGATLDFGKGVIVTPQTITETKYIASITILPGTKKGSRDVSMTNPGGGTRVKRGVFKLQ
jgi:hypothetical protein